MSSFRDARDLILLSYDEGILSDNEFLLLFNSYQSNNLDFPYDSYAEFDLDEMEEDECISEFRVKKRDIPLLAEALQIPPYFRCYQRSKVDGLEGLCMLLKRFSYPCRYSDMIPRFGRPVPVFSLVTNEVLDYVYTLHSHRITTWNPILLNRESLRTYAQAISDKGSPLNNCFGFIDGTVRPITRPGKHQRIVYNGHKRVHALKFQSVALPNGMIGNLYGPVGKLIPETFYFHELFIIL